MIPNDGRSAFMLKKLELMVAEAYERGVQGSPERCGLLEGACNVWKVNGSPAHLEGEWFASSLGR